MRRVAKVLEVSVDKVTLDTAMERMIELLNEQGCSMVTTPNSEMIMAAADDEMLMEALGDSDLCIPDGIGLVIASKIQNLGLLERVTGVDLMGRLLQYTNDHRLSIYILGGKPDVAKQASINISRIFPSIIVVGYHDGYFQKEDEDKIISEINHGKTDILFVGLGSPKQEKWIYEKRKRLDVKVAMGVGGSVDIWAGTAKRAPKAFQRLGLEWLYRLIREPWRYKRMLVLPKFLIRVLRD